MVYEFVSYKPEFRTNNERSEKLKITTVLWTKNTADENRKSTMILYR